MAESNGLNPQFDSIELPGGVKIYAGTAYDDTTIKASIPAAPTASSIYLGTSSGTPGVWILVSTTWTKLTVN